MTKIVVGVRTLNEEELIEGFIHSYSFADQILVSDGGSTDRTLEIASRYYPKVKVRQFRHIVWNKPRTIWRTHEGKHINHLLNWADEEGAEWVIFEDADHRCNYLLKRYARDIIEHALWIGKQTIHLYRLYRWLDEGYFPQLMQPELGDHGKSIWGWDTRYPHRTREEGFEFHYAFESIPPPESGKNMYLDPPLVVIHHGWREFHQMEKKIAYYREWGIGHDDPLNYCGPVQPWPAWAREEE